jgi:Ala-tRNA(Pro) deacylase
MAIPEKLVSYLNDNKVAYEILHHPEAFTAQTIAEAEHIKGRHHAKVVMVKSGGQDLMAVLAADRRIDVEKLEKITGQAVAIATEATNTFVSV